MRRPLLILIMLLVAIQLPAAVGLTTVPDRDGVRLTIYNAVDLTLVQERRSLVLRPGLNRIQYQWAGTLIDTTSLELRALDHQDQVTISDVIYPPGAPATLVWQVQSEFVGPVRFEISYFTSGLSWSADYSLLADQRETSAELQCTVAVVNQSGEDYPEAEVRLVVGSINLVEQIRDLASGQMREQRRALDRDEVRKSARDAMMANGVGLAAPAPAMEMAMEEAPEVVSRRLGDYHIFSISGTQAVPGGGTTRFIAISSEEALDLEVLYRVNLGDDMVQKLYRFINDDEHHLPEGPLPEGHWHVLRQAKDGQLSYSGGSHHDYVPPGQKVELHLGEDPAIIIEQHLLARQQSDFHFNNDGRVDGWIEHQRYDFRLVNTKPIPVSLEYLVQTGGGAWQITDLVGERRNEHLYRHRSQVAAGVVLELGPFVISNRKGWQGRDLPWPPVPPLPTFPAIVRGE